MDVDEIWELECRFWLEGAQVYEAHLHEDAHMIFPAMGILDRTAILNGLREFPRWTHVDMCNRQAFGAGNTVCVAYIAIARRGEAQPYRCFCGSTYVRAGNGPIMVAHQQTLMD